MAKFMLILHNPPNVWRNVSPEEMERKVGRYRAWAAKFHSSGRLVSSEKLQEEGGRVLRLRNGRASTAP